MNFYILNDSFVNMSDLIKTTQLNICAYVCMKIVYIYIYKSLRLSIKIMKDFSHELEQIYIYILVLLSPKLCLVFVNCFIWFYLVLSGFIWFTTSWRRLTWNCRANKTQDTNEVIKSFSVDSSNPSTHVSLTT